MGQPGIFFESNYRNLVVDLGGDQQHDHSPSPWLRDDFVVECDVPACRKRLLELGGVELRKTSAFYPLDVSSMTIRAVEGGHHFHEPDPKTGEVACSNPYCVSQFAIDFRLGLCGDRVETRPPTTAERDAADAAFWADVDREAAIEDEVRRRRQWTPFDSQRVALGAQRHLR